MNDEFRTDDGVIARQILAEETIEPFVLAVADALKQARENGFTEGLERAKEEAELISKSFMGQSVPTFREGAECTARSIQNLITATGTDRKSTQTGPAESARLLQKRIETLESRLGEAEETLRKIEESTTFPTHAPKLRNWVIERERIIPGTADAKEWVRQPGTVNAVDARTAARTFANNDTNLGSGYRALELKKWMLQEKWILQSKGVSVDGSDTWKTVVVLHAVDSDEALRNYAKSQRWSDRWQQAKECFRAIELVEF